MQAWCKHTQVRTAVTVVRGPDTDATRRQNCDRHRLHRVYARPARGAGDVPFRVCAKVAGLAVDVVRARVKLRGMRAMRRDRKRRWVCRPLELVLLIHNITLTVGIAVSLGQTIIHTVRVVSISSAGRVHRRTRGIGRRKMYRCVSGSIRATVACL